jgi:hypothetical protein
MRLKGKLFLNAMLKDSQKLLKLSSTSLLFMTFVQSVSVSASLKLLIFSVEKSPLCTGVRAVLLVVLGSSSCDPLYQV